MNYVTLIGKMDNAPQLVNASDGKKMVRFNLITQDKSMDKDGRSKKLTMKHELFAWGKWIRVLQDFGSEGQSIAVEGKLVYRFYRSNGRPVKVAEVEVNDLIIM